MNNFLDKDYLSNEDL
jgi:hypothetical protein